MYEEFFGLRSRPFSPLPRAETFIPLAPVREPLEALARCVAQEQGIGVITGPPGSGKSLACRLLQQRFSELRRTVLLTTARFPTRRALLQAILFELKHPFIGLSEQEARLRVLDLLQASPAPQNRMLLIVDEAHLLSPRGLEELRTLTDYEMAGMPCVSLILSGQFELEELLTEPEMNAFNQRVGCHVCLEPLTFEESGQYLRERLRFAGNNGLTVFTPEAIHLICTASEGNPRRLNQLSDHSLLLAYAEEERPVTEAIVRSALLDLRELPLHWNAPLDLTLGHERNPLQEFAESVEAEDNAAFDDSLTECDTDLDTDLDEESLFETETFDHAEEAESSVFEIGSPLDESAIDQLFQVAKFVVPSESIDADESVEAQAAPPSPNWNLPQDTCAFETALPEVETSETDMESPLMFTEAQPVTAMEWGQPPVSMAETQLPFAVESARRPSEFEELIVEDAYAAIDRQLETNVRQPVREPSVEPIASVTPPVAVVDAVSVEDGIDETLFETESDSEWMESSELVDLTATEPFPVLLETQLLDFINEISVDVREFRKKSEAHTDEYIAPDAVPENKMKCAAPRHQSLRQMLKWQYDVVDPESAETTPELPCCESQSALSVSTPCTVNQMESSSPVAAPKEEKAVPTAASVEEAHAEQPSNDERRYAQLFTRLQRQRRRVENVMHRDDMWARR